MTEKKEAAAVKSEVAKKTEPEIRESDSSQVFRLEYLVQVDNSSKVPNEVHERNKRNTKEVAVQRGLLPTGDAKLDTSEIQDDQNVLLTYEVPVKLNQK